MTTTFTCTCIDRQYDLEFTASGIAEDIAALNFRSWNPLDDNELDDVFTLLIAEPQHRNNGTLAGRAQNDLANTLRSGGWLFAGYKGVCVKPTLPRIVEGKTIKYESPRGAGSLQLLIPHISWSSGRKIAAKAGAAIEAEYLERLDANANPRDEDCYFWDWFLDTNLPLVITEGAKKACSLVSAGYPAIALNGIWGWGTNIKDEDGNVERDDSGKSLKIIHPDLEPFLDGREIVLALDRDPELKTKRMVEAAKAAFVRAIEGDDIPVTQLTWRTPKGIDDYIHQRGEKALDRLYANRQAVKVKPIRSQDNEPIGFTTDRERGLMLLSEVDGETRSKWIGNHLEAIAYVNNPTQDEAALYLEFKTIRGQIRRWTMPRANLAGDGTSIIAELLRRDYAFDRKQKYALLDYLFSLGQEIDRSITITDTSGWSDKSFVLHHKTYGDESLRFRDVDPPPDAIAKTRGTLQEWKDNVAARCGGNSRLILGLGASFAAPLLPLVGIESGGFHLVGDNSQGKTTILSVAASVTGVKELPHWRTTTNGLESIATAFNHLCLPLDEIGQADARDVGNMAYMLANGQGKTRMKRDLGNRQNKTWQLIVLSSGEVGMGSYMQQAGITQKGGQEVRLPDIPAVPDGAGYGCFETIHECQTGTEFVNDLTAAVKKYHGTALDGFLARLVADAANPDFAGHLATQTHLIAAKLAEGTVDNAIARVAKRFALVQVALGLAHKYNLLPFPIEQIEWAIANCFNSWYNARGGDGSIEVKRAIDNIQHLLMTNEFSDRVYTLPHNNDRPVRNLLAYRKVGIDGHTEELCVPPSIFDREFCNGANKTELIKELQRLGLILAPRADGKPTHKRQIDGKRLNFYVFQSFENEGVQGVRGVRKPSNLDIAINPDLEQSVPPPESIGVQGVHERIEQIDRQNQSVPPAPPAQNRGVRKIENGESSSEQGVEERTPRTPRTPAKERERKESKSQAEFKAGDRVRYVGGMGKYQGWSGTVIKVVHGSNWAIDWDNGKATESIPASELIRL